MDMVGKQKMGIYTYSEEKYCASTIPFRKFGNIRIELRGINLFATLSPVGITSVFILPHIHHDVYSQNGNGANKCKLNYIEPVCKYRTAYTANWMEQHKYILWKGEEAFQATCCKRVFQAAGTRTRERLKCIPIWSHPKNRLCVTFWSTKTNSWTNSWANAGEVNISWKRKGNKCQNLCCGRWRYPLPLPVCIKRYQSRDWTPLWLWSSIAIWWNGEVCSGLDLKKKTIYQKFIGKLLTGPWMPAFYQPQASKVSHISIVHIQIWITTSSRIPRSCILAK